ncbi:MAG: hypothetical protein GYA23_12020 [Methanomicrobiales archaeon]|nr:hypothetical protein [Methanomicrobiales archaeon]
MPVCPGCGRALPSPEGASPAGKPAGKKPFTIKAFLWENFRFFTMIGITGTMISLVPTMGTRILGTSWITGSDNILPLSLSIIILFGAIFISICFLLIFSLILAGRADEAVLKRAGSGFRWQVTLYEGDFQRVILLACLVPMWMGMVMFFVLLMPMIPNRYSWFFAMVTLLACIPLVVYTFLGWNIGRHVVGRIPGMARHPRTSTVLFYVCVFCILLFLAVGVPLLTEERNPDPADIRIKTDQQYFSPHISSAQGLRLQLTNITGRDFRMSRHTWSADYGYFVRVIPSTGEVTILGNPAVDETADHIYWTYPATDPGRNATPVTIRAQLYPLHGDTELVRSSITLDWFTNDIVTVRQPYVPLP